MAIPGWALALGVGLEAPKVANNYMDLFKNINSIRDDSNAADELRRIEQFKTSDEARALPPDVYLGAKNYQTLQKLRAEKLDALQRGEAAVPLGQIRDLQLDPRFQDAASLEEINKNPTQAVFGQNMPQVSGVLPGAEKGSVVAAPGYNPYVSSGIADFASGNQNTLDAFRASNQDRMAGARLVQNKDLAAAFKNVSEGQKDYAGVDEKARESKAEQELNKFIAENEMPRDVTGWNNFWDKIRKIPNLPAKLISEQQAAMQSRNQAPVGAPLTQFVKNGPNSTRSEVRVDMFGEPIASTRTVSSNNPSDREMGLIPEGTGEGKLKAPVFYIITKPDGRTVQVDGNTPTGRNRLAAATKNGERISKLGTESVSQTAVNADGSTTNQRITGPTASGTPAVTVVRENGKLVIKR